MKMRFYSTLLASGAVALGLAAATIPAHADWHRGDGWQGGWQRQNDNRYYGGWRRQDYNRGGYGWRRRGDNQGDNGWQRDSWRGIGAYASPPPAYYAQPQMSFGITLPIGR
ncbi:hypothetical protein [Acidiphilium iwatense]|nr:hypothetical protein [Acidiphilium iwatense]